jgi:hypothetical protein
VLPPGYRALIYRDYGSPSPVFAGKHDVGVAFFRVGLTNQGQFPKRKQLGSSRRRQAELLGIWSSPSCSLKTGTFYLLQCTIRYYFDLM